MKIFQNPLHCCCAILGAILLAKAVPAFPQENSQSPIRIDLVTSNSEYLDTDPIKVRVEVSNVSGVPILVQKGFLARDFHLLIDFIDPDGQSVRVVRQPVGVEPRPPRFVRDLSGRVRPAVPCEEISPSDSTLLIFDDLRVDYDLTKVGLWEGRVVTSLQTFGEFIARSDGTLRCFLDDPPPKSFSPLTSNLVRFNIARSIPLAQSDIHAHARLMTIGTGTHPPVSKSDIAGMSVKLIPNSVIPDDLRPVNHKNYGRIFDNVVGKAVKSVNTGDDGIARFLVAIQDDYVLVARHGPSGTAVGAKIDADEPEWSTSEVVSKKLMVMQNNKGKKSAGKATRRRGSDLWIFEPEYVEWDSTQEPYPFIFESIGDWSVTTSVTPPEGFVSDYPELSADVNSETEAVQFLVTDIGSSWTETTVNHKISHKGKSEIIKSVIGVKLSKRLAKAKGLPVYGDTPGPGTFRGGKRIKDKDKANEKNK